VIDRRGKTSKARKILGKTRGSDDSQQNLNLTVECIEEGVWNVTAGQLGTVRIKGVCELVV
jgi:hypothetical protein